MDDLVTTYIACKTDLEQVELEAVRVRSTLTAARIGLRDARYCAGVSVPCPVPSCGARVDVPCRWVRSDGEPGYLDVSPHHVHSLREDLAGLHGPVNQKAARAWAGSRR